MSELQEIDPTEHDNVIPLYSMCAARVDEWEALYKTERVRRRRMGVFRRAQFGHRAGFRPGPEAFRVATRLEAARRRDVARAEFNRVTRPGDQFDGGELVNAEYNPEFMPGIARGRSGRLGKLQEYSTDAVFGEGRDNVYQALVSGYMTVEPSKRVPKEQRELAAEQAAAIAANVDEVVTNQIKLEFIDGCFNTGFSLWERVLKPEGGLSELAYVRSDALDEWIVNDQETKLLAAKFDTGEHSFTLDAQNIALYSHMRTGMNLEGIAQVRRVATLIEMKRTLLNIMMFAHEVHGLGAKIIEQDPMAPNASGNNDQGEKIVNIFKNMSWKDATAVQLAPGKTFRWYAPANGLPNFEPFIRWLDEQIAMPASAEGNLIGFQDYGSKALAESKDANHVKSAHHYGLLLAGFINEEVIPFIAESMFGEATVYPLPKARFSTSQEARDPERYKRWASYVGSGMLHWTLRDENQLRALEGLEPITQEEWDGAVASTPEELDEAEDAPQDGAAALLAEAKERGAAALNDAMSRAA